VSSLLELDENHVEQRSVLLNVDSGFSSTSGRR